MYEEVGVMRLNTYLPTAMITLERWDGLLMDLEPGDPALLCGLKEAHNANVSERRQVRKPPLSRDIAPRLESYCQ